MGATMLPAAAGRTTGTNGDGNGDEATYQTVKADGVEVDVEISRDLLSQSEGRMLSIRGRRPNGRAKEE